jgi:chromosome segregation ATPase
MLTNSNKDLTALKGELQKALHERNDSIAKCNRYESSLQETKDELTRTRDQYQAARQLIEEYKVQLQVAKGELEAAHSRFASREKELK